MPRRGAGCLHLCSSNLLQKKKMHQLPTPQNFQWHQPRAAIPPFSEPSCSKVTRWVVSKHAQTKQICSQMDPWVQGRHLHHAPANPLQGPLPRGIHRATPIDNTIVQLSSATRHSLFKCDPQLGCSACHSPVPGLIKPQTTTSARQSAQVPCTTSDVSPFDHKMVVRWCLQV